MFKKLSCLFNVLFALNVEGMSYIIKRFIYSIDDYDQKLFESIVPLSIQNPSREKMEQ